MPELTFLEKLFVFLQHLLPQHTASRLVSILADTRSSSIKNFLIGQFIKSFSVDMREAKIKQIEEFDSFNEFFTRELEEGVRSFDSDAKAICSPADGRISQCGPIEDGRLIQAKGHEFKLDSLMGGDIDIANDFKRGWFSTIYLSPRDYHRVHMPLDGKLVATRYVPGKLFSVNDVTAQSVPHLYARNERLICIFESSIGRFAIILVGAMIVAGIETVWSGQVTPGSKLPFTQEYTGPLQLAKGDEMGRFKLGSTVILLFPEDAIDEDSFSTEPDEGGVIKLGEKIATLT